MAGEKLKNIKKIFRQMNGIIGIWNFSETICGIYKRGAGLTGCLEVSQRISHINRGIQLIAFHDAADIVALGFSRIAGTEMAFKQSSQTAGLKENLDIAGLAVADNEQPVGFSEGLQRFFQTGIEGRAFFQKRPVLFLTAGVDQLQLPLAAFPGKYDGSNFRERFAEQAPERFGCQQRKPGILLTDNGVPGFGTDGGGIPQGAVHIKNNTVHKDLLSDLLDLRQAAGYGPADCGVRYYFIEMFLQKQAVCVIWGYIYGRSANNKERTTRMQYRRIREGRFVGRPNRFIARVEIDGKEELCHVKNTGRLRELLVPQARVFVEESDNPRRKTRFDLVQVYKGDRLVNIDSQMPNYLVREWIEAGGLFPDVTSVAMERRYGNSRFDLYVEHGGKKAFLEVKGVTLEVDKTARFPDAPTERGVRHMQELMGCLSEGYEAYLIFVIQMKGVASFQANWATQPEFGRVLRQAADAGVSVIACDCQVLPGNIFIDQKIPVDFCREIE